jgi:hypothetical protein
MNLRKSSMVSFSFLSVVFAFDIVPPKCIRRLLTGFTTVGTNLFSPHMLLLLNSVLHRRAAQSTLGVIICVEGTETNPRIRKRIAQLIAIIATSRLVIVLANLPELPPLIIT